MVGTGGRSALPLVLLGCCWCSVAAAVRFKGFDSQSFEFSGVPESVYNILSEQNHQLNARLVAAPTDAETADSSSMATWMGELVFRYKADEVHVTVDSLGQMAVSANGEPLVWERLLVATQEGDSRRTLTLPAGTHLVLVHSGDGKAASATQGLVSQGAAKDTERLLVATPDMTLAVRVALPRQQQQQPRRWRLDIAVLSISPYLCDVHGVLGQTYKRQYGVTPGPFTVEGAVFDYEVPSLRSDSFHFNRFRSGSGLGCGGDSGSNSGDSASSDGSSGTGISGSGTSEAIEAMVVPIGVEGQQQMLRPMVEVDGTSH